MINWNCIMCQLFADILFPILFPFYFPFYFLFISHFIFFLFPICRRFGFKWILSTSWIDKHRGTQVPLQPLLSSPSPFTTSFLSHFSLHLESWIQKHRGTQVPLQPLLSPPFTPHQYMTTYPDRRGQRGNLVPHSIIILLFIIPFLER